MSEEKNKIGPVLDDDGNTLYGFSQTNLEKVHRLLLILVWILIIFLGIVIYILWKVQRWHIIGKIIAALASC